MTDAVDRSELGFREVEWVSDQLGLDKNTVYRYLNEGRLPGLQLGKKWLIEEEGLRVFLRREQRLQTERRQAENITASLQSGDDARTIMTVVFSDIVGGSALIDRLGDDDWLDLIRRHDQLVWDALPGAGHTEVKSIGDGFMVAFDAADEALRFVQRYQRALESYRADPAKEAIRVKVGIHGGPVTLTPGDVNGRTVFIAALVGAAAEADEPLVSAATVTLLQSSQAFAFGEPRDVTLKVGGRTRVMPLAWRDPQ